MYDSTVGLRRTFADIEPLLEHQNASVAPAKLPRNRRAGHTGTDNDHIQHVVFLSAAFQGRSVIVGLSVKLTVNGSKFQADPRPDFLCARPPTGSDNSAGSADDMHSFLFVHLFCFLRKVSIGHDQAHCIRSADTKKRFPAEADM